jgi:hypothetical protein
VFSPVAASRVVTHVAEDHELDIDGRTPGFGDVVHLAVGDGPVVHPRAEDRPDGAPELFHGVVGEFPAGFFLDGGLEPDDEVLEVGGREVGVALDATLVLFGLYDDLEGVDVVLMDRLEAEDDIAVHLDEAAVGIVDEALVTGLGDERRGRLVVEAQVEDGVHHPGHRGPGPGADGDKERVLGIAERLADRLLQLLKILSNFEPDGLRDLVLILIKEGANLGRDRESWRDRQPDPGHLGQVGALAAEDVLHFHIAFGGAGPEEKDILLSHRSTPEH